MSQSEWENYKHMSFNIQYLNFKVFFDDEGPYYLQMSLFLMVLCHEVGTLATQKWYPLTDYFFCGRSKIERLSPLFSNFSWNIT